MANYCPVCENYAKEATRFREQVERLTKLVAKYQDIAKVNKGIHEAMEYRAKDAEAELTRLREQVETLETVSLMTAEKYDAQVNQLQAANAVVDHSELFSELSPHHRALVKAYRATQKGGA